MPLHCSQPSLYIFATKGAVLSQPIDEFKPLGRLNKQVIRQFIEFGCPRQLFLNLGRGDDRWMDPVREIRTPKGPVRQPELLLNMGREYEQDVYTRLRFGGLHVRLHLGAHDTIVPGQWSPQWGRELAQSLAPGGSLFLLEYEWPTPSTMLTWMMGLGPGQETPHRQALGVVQARHHVVRAPTGAP